MSKFGNYIEAIGQQIDREIETEVYKYLPKNSKAVYLDCGCDDGAKTIERAEKIGTKHILGYEVEKTRASKARKRKIKTYSVDLNKQSWPIKASTIDVITATEVIEHLYHTDNFMQQAKNALKRGGLLIVSSDNLASWQNIFALIIGNQPYSGPFISRNYPIGHRPNAKFYKNNMNNTMEPHLNIMTAKAMKQLFEAYDFKIIEHKTIGFYPFPIQIGRSFAKLDKYHGAHSFCVAQKA